MKTRPWPLIILAFMQFLAPISNIFLSAWVMRMAPGDYLAELWHGENWLMLFDFFLLLPIAGVAIFMVKKWSYPVFLSVIAWSLYSNFEAWRTFPQLVHLPIVLCIFAANVALVSYFLLPAVRLAYFNPRLRWWENKPRYEWETDAQVTLDTGEILVRVQNVSEGGMFIAPAEALKAGDSIRARFAIQDEKFEVDCKVVYRLSAGGGGFGVQFVLTPEIHQRLKQAMRALDRAGIKRRPEKVAWHQGFKEWVTTLLTTGTGLVPEIPSSYRKPVQSNPVEPPCNVEQTSTEDRAA